MEGDGHSPQKKLGYLTHTFLTKTIEAIHFIRCPEQFPDFELRGRSWLSTNVPSSPTLQQQVAADSLYGWFSVDISITDPVHIVERWYLIHLPLKSTESGSALDSSLEDCKRRAHRSFSQCFRGIFSMLHFLPAAHLCFVLKQFKAVKRSLIGNTSSFQRFPARIQGYTDTETAILKFGPVVTPIGKTVVICQHRIDLLSLIPTPVRCVPFPMGRSISIPEPVLDSYGLSLSAHVTVGMSPMSEVSLASFLPEHSVSGFEVIDKDFLDPEIPPPIEEFIAALTGRKTPDFGPVPSPAEVVERVRAVQAELRSLQAADS
jgi:hypothetical protein